ncbi:hypothetical protein BgAZ_502840 [Babesia gibsoni]|uniref:BOV57 n=1 Tax=Babesia gibsoni TaxID=33632 RepID=A0AAD8LHZ9_BABGI|nr:hypothetical protein BgAZ_502840 [Babesia gibsoni]
MVLLKTFMLTVLLQLLCLIHGTDAFTLKQWANSGLPIASIGNTKQSQPTDVEKEEPKDVVDHDSKDDTSSDKKETDDDFPSFDENEMAKLLAQNDMDSKKGNQEDANNAALNAIANEYKMEGDQTKIVPVDESHSSDSNIDTMDALMQDYKSDLSQTLKPDIGNMDAVAEEAKVEGLGTVKGKEINPPAGCSTNGNANKDFASVIPNIPSDDAPVTTGNEDSIIDDTAASTHAMRMLTLKEIDQTLIILENNLKKFLSAVSISAHDLGYYEKLLEVAYDMFCKEINGHLGTHGNSGSSSETPVEIMISADMSNAIRRSFDTKIEVLELAASEVAAQKSKEIGARTLYNAFANGLRHVKNLISSPGLTIKNTVTEMKVMSSVVEDLSKSFAADVINTTLLLSKAKKELYDQLVKRQELILSGKDNSANIDGLTGGIHKLANTFHQLQNKKADAVQKQNGFKEYMNMMKMPMNTVQRLIDSYFASVHNIHAKAVLSETKEGLRADDKTESELRLRVAEGQVLKDANIGEKLSSQKLACPPKYAPLYPDRPIDNSNPCVLVDKKLPTM